MTRKPYWQKLLNDCYPLVGVIAVRQGLDGALEEAITHQLVLDYGWGNPDAMELIRECDFNPTAAAYLITSSQIKENDTATS
jgi:hypothetical protein